MPCPPTGARVAGRVVANMGAGGLGDALLGLVATRGLQASGREVDYRVHPDALPFVRLFTGWDALGVHVHDDNRDSPPNSGADYELNLGYNEEVRTKARRPRWERYCANAGGVLPMLPAARDPAALLAAGKAYAGCVAVFPFCAWQDRLWRIESWRTTVRLLKEAGHRVIVLDSRADRCRTLDAEHLAGASAEVVAGVMLGAGCVLGLDSGPTHLAGLLGVPTLVLTGKTTAEPIFGFYPRAKGVKGVLDCGGCWWQGDYSDATCKATCAAMGTILPSEVVRLVGEAVCSRARPHTLLSPDRLASLRREARETSHLPGVDAELGVCKGGSALAMADAAPGKLLRLFDTFTGLPSSCPEGPHVAGEFAVGEAEVRALLAGQNVAFHPGFFPDSAKDLENERYSCVHVDGDLYETTRAACEYFWPRLSPGGVILWDDYGWPHTPGVTRALREFFPEGGIEVVAPHQAQTRKPD